MTNIRVALELITRLSPPPSHSDALHRLPRPHRDDQALPDERTTVAAGRSSHLKSANVSPVRTYVSSRNLRDAKKKNAKEARHGLMAVIQRVS